jgi:FkbM family methyltransferase
MQAMSMARERDAIRPVVKITGLENLPARPQAHSAPGKHVPASSPAALAEALASQLQINEAIAARLLETERLVRDTQQWVRSLSSRRAAVYVGDHLALTRIQNRFLMYADTRDFGLSPHLLIDGVWEPGLTRLLEGYVRPGMTVVDIGANYGYFTLLAASLIYPGEGLVYAIEPHPRNFEILQKNVAMNWLGKWVRCFQCALLDASRPVELHSAPGLLGSSSLFVKSLEGQTFQPIPVTSRPLDEIVSGPVDVIKMDAEGSEPLIFEGMTEILKCSPRLKILMEFNVPALEASGVDPRHFLQRLRALNFSPFIVTDVGQPEPLEDAKLWKGSMISNLLLSRG